MCGCIIEIGEDSTPQQPIYVDDESNQHLMNYDQSNADNSTDANCSNYGDNNIVMQETVVG